MGISLNRPPPGGRTGLRSKGRMAVSVAAALAVGLGFSLLSVTSASATTGNPPYHLVVSVASPQVVNAPFNFTVTLVDNGGSFAAPCPTSLITFQTNSSHLAFTAPSGNLSATTCSVTGQATINLTGSTFTIWATDSDPTVTDAIPVTVTVNPVNTATHFSVVAPADVTLGIGFSFTVQALNSDGTQADYNGTVSFSSNCAGTLPGPTAIDSATVQLVAHFDQLGSCTITASDGQISGSDTVNVLTETLNATHFLVTAPAVCVAPGAAFTVTVTALHSDGTTDANFSGTVHFASSDPAASLPADSTLANGTGSFSVILRTNGTQSIIATGVTTQVVEGSSNVCVGAAVVPPPIRILTPTPPTPVPAPPRTTG
jgi:hypothetical protein